MSTPVARLADALKAADDKNPADNESDHYMWLAHAAIEALQLEEEHDTETYFEEVAESPYLGHKRFAGRRKITRLVGPWRTT